MTTRTLPPCPGCKVKPGVLHLPDCGRATCIHTGRPVTGCRIIHDHGRGMTLWRGADPATLSAMAWNWYSYYDVEDDLWKPEVDGQIHAESQPDSDRVLREAYWQPAQHGWVRVEELPERDREENV